MMKTLWPVILFLIAGGCMQLDSWAQENIERATFAGGCFWCMEADFEKVSGVKKVTSGYAGGTGADPTYNDYGEKGHIEVVQVEYDPSTITYTELLDYFWKHIDPIDSGGQFCDRGHEYTTAIFYHTDQQRRLAEESKSSLEESGKIKKPIATKLIKAGKFYPAEEYHQSYYKKNPLKYKFYRFNCGRDKRIREIWGESADREDVPRAQSKYKKKSQDDLKRELTPLQYKVTQEDGTEPAFRNEYWNNKKEGIYVDIVSGEPLFSSFDKFESGTGWPSFTKPLEPENIVEKEDRHWFSVRTEVRSKHAGSHLGHVFNDGPPPAGLRYCLNSAALRFIAKEDLEKEGYGEYKNLFER